MSLSQILENRTYLLTIIGLATTISTLGPFFVVEAFTVQMAAHAVLHISAITFGIFLIILSIIAYKRTENSSMIFTTLAFMTFTGLSIFLLDVDLNSVHAAHSETVWIDVLLTLMIGFFGVGVFANQTFRRRTTYN